jgi:hypothetical protein
MLAGVQRLVTSAPPRTLHVMAMAREEDGRWVVDLEMQGAASGKRTLRAGTCMSVARATVLIVALALDPQARASDELAREEAAPPEVPDREREPAQPEALPEKPAPVAPKPSSGAVAAVTEAGVRPIAFLGAGAERALLPGWSASAIIGGGVVWRSLRFDLSGQIAPGTSARTRARPAESESLAQVPRVGADLSLLAIALRACAGGGRAWIAIHGCASVRGSRITGQGTGLAQSYRDAATIVSLEPGVLLRLPARTRVGLEIDLVGVVPITHPDFVILTAAGDSSAELFRPSTVGLRGALGAGLRF